MPFELYEVAAGKCLLVKVTGHATGEENFHANAQIERLEGGMARWYFAIVDLTQASVIEHSSAQLRQVAEQNERMAKTSRKGFLLAVVAPAELLFGIARMWQVFAESTGWETKIFRSRGGAEQWLRIKVRTKFSIELPEPPWQDAKPVGEEH